MVQDSNYVKMLIRKRLDDTITPAEELQLEAARQHYEEDDFLEMVAEVLLASEGDLPEEPLRHWRPDFARIVEDDRERRRHVRVWQTIRFGAVAATVVLLLSIGYVMRRQVVNAPFIVGDCTDITDSMEIPSSAFAGTVFGNGIEPVLITPSHVGTVAHKGNVVAEKTSDGVIRFAYSSQSHAPDSGARYFAVTTAARQQCVVELLDGTRIRLNAGSALQYSLSPQPGGPALIRFAGEAWVQLPADGRKSKSPLLIETADSRLLADAGDFVVRTDPGGTNVMLLDGHMTVQTIVGGKTQELGRAGDVATASRGTLPGQETLRLSRGGSVASALSWTKAKRTYKNVPLRQFVLDASRWYGFKIQDINCIPADRRISAALCYRAPKNELFAAIKAAGVMMDEREGLLVFCPGAGNIGSAGRPVM